MTRLKRSAAPGLVGLLAVGAIAACGTTVPRESWPSVGANPSGAISENLSGPTTTAIERPTVVPTTAAARVGVPRSHPSAAEPPPIPSGSRSEQPTRSSSAAAKSPPPKTGTGPIKIGYGYIDSGDSNGILAGIGKGLASADLHGEMQAYVAHLNESGGVLGRKLQMVFYRANTLDSLQSMGQGVCATETQDNRVDLSLDANYGGVVFPCLAKAQVPVLYVGMDALTRADYRSFPLVTEPDSIAIDRLASVEVPQLVKMGYKPTGSQRLGVLYFNSGSFTAGFHALKAAWAARGVKVTASAALTNFNTVSQIASLEAAVQAAELRFRTQGVTHVMCVETNAFICGFFGLYAASQGYYPRYAFTSDQPLTNVLANVPAKGLTGSVFVGWNPAQDLSRLSSMPAGVRSCWAFMNKHGFATGTGNERDGAASVCEALDYAVATLKAAGSTNPQAIAAAAQRIGPTYRSRHVLGVGTGQDGVDLVRRGAYERGCGCFAYTSPPIKVR